MRKSFIFMLLASVLLISLVACGGGSASPTTTVKGYINAIVENDMNALKNYTTDEVVAMMTSYGSIIRNQINEYGKATKFSETITGDTAKVTVTFANGEQHPFECKKIDGKWKVTG